MRIALVLLLCSLSVARAEESQRTLPADIIELSPDLYLLTHRGRLEGTLDVQHTAIQRANEFAAQLGGVAAPVVGRFVQVGLTLKVYQYQFRVMSREQAVALRPVMADAVITVNNTGQCSPNAAVTSLLPDLHGIRELHGLDLLARLPEPPAEDDSPRMENKPAFCMPGQICEPAQQCLPGWQCSPGTTPSPEPPAPAAPAG